MKANLIKIFIIVIIMFILSSCAPRYNVLVGANSSSKRIQNMKYFLVPSSDIYEKSLQFINFSSLTEKLLKEKGLNRVYNYAAADAIVILHYGMSSKDIQNEYTSPIYGQTGTYTQVVGNNVYSTPKYGVISYATDKYTTTIFTCSLGLSAVKLDNGQLDDELWNVVAATSCDEGLNAAFPAMLTAIRDYITLSSQEMITVIIDARNTDIVINEER
jgi:hypothetical protein